MSLLQQSVDQFRVAVAFTLQPDIEGGLSDDPNDTGGITNLGLTIADLTVFERHRCTADDVRALTVQTAIPVYQALYWNVIRGYGLPHGVSLSVFDHGVNRGNGTSAKILQHAVGLTGSDVDGFIGAETLYRTRMAAANLSGLLALLHIRQRDDYAALHNEHYENGWEARADKRYAAALVAAGLPRP